VGVSKDNKWSKWSRCQHGTKSCVVAHQTKKNSAGSPALASARISPKICQRQLRTIYSEHPKFHPHLFTSGRVIAGRVNIVQTRDGRPAEYRWRPLRRCCNSIPCTTPQSLAADPAAGVPCSNAANIGERKTWTQSEVCTWRNSVRCN